MQLTRLRTSLIQKLVRNDPNNAMFGGGGKNFHVIPCVVEDDQMAVIL